VLEPQANAPVAGRPIALQDEADDELARPMLDSKRIRQPEIVPGTMFG
jgi:hypothetical protein